MAARIAMIAITTSSSISVKPCLLLITLITGHLPVPAFRHNARGRSRLGAVTPAIRHARLLWQWHHLPVASRLEWVIGPIEIGGSLPYARHCVKRCVR